MSCKLNDLFKEGKVRLLAGWHADASLVQLDRLVLRVAFPAEGDGGIDVGEVRGTVVRDTRRGQHVLFDNRSLVRISDGPRKGLIVKASGLRVEEQARLASWTSSAKSRANQGFARYTKLLEWFESRLEACGPAVDKMPAPELLVSCQDVSGLHARLTGKAVQFLKPYPAENPDDALKRRWRELSEEHADREGYRLLPLRYVTGRGGVYAKLLVRVSEQLNDAVFQFNNPAPAEGTEIVTADELCQIEVRR